MTSTKSLTKSSKISWDVSGTDEIFIRKIVERAILSYDHQVAINREDSIMDLTAAHCNGCPLKLAEFLKADPGNFAHDFFGIRRFLDRETGKLTECFLPRFYDSKAA